jgi:hypothetical protein
LTILHLISPTQKDTSYDVVFVHGLGGDAFKTWKPETQDVSWLYWLDADLPGARILSIEYESAPSLWLGQETMPIYDRANNLLALLEAKHIGERPIVFITHSLGGLIVKRILQNDSGVNSNKTILSNTRAVIFLSTPHHGSDFAQSFGVLRRAFKLSVVATELEANKVELRALHNWYRDNATGYNIATFAYFETQDTKYGRVVNETSSDPGIPNTRPIGIDADHFEICKPTSKEELVYITVLESLRHLFPNGASSEISPAISGGENHPSKGTTFTETSSFLETVKALEDLFYFRWERGSYNTGIGTSIVYWPVRLRHPTFIHAAQSFAAAGLQQRGADIRLFIDDLGEQNFPPDEFASQLSKWFAGVGGDTQKLKISKFSEIIPQDDATSDGLADPWPTIRKWLGETAYRFDVILKVSKLFPGSGGLDELTARRPRRLLTPALVWTCLSHVNMASPQQPLVTLGGYDEKPLWEAWRDRRISPNSSVGHLYAPQLFESDNQHGDTPLHMANTLRYSLEWKSKDDIRQALNQEFETDKWKEAGKLVWWCLKCCVFLPRFFRGQDVRLPLNGGFVDQHTALDDLSPSLLFSTLTQELATWL